LFEAYRRVLALPRTLGLMLMVATQFLGFFAFIAGSPFALIVQLHLSSTQFAIAFAINSTSFIVASALNARLVRFVEPERLFAGGTVLVFVATVFAWSVDTYAPSVAGFIAGWSLFAFGVAFTVPGAYGALLSLARTDAGLAAGLLGATQAVGGAIGGTLSGAQSALPTTTLGLFALLGGIGTAAGYLLSKPPWLAQAKSGS